MSFLVGTFFHSMRQHQSVQLEAARRGFERHGLTVIKSTPDNPIECDLAVIWSCHQKKIIEAQERSGRDYLVMERGYMGDRFEWTSMGINGLNGRAQFYANGMPGDRWEKYFSGLMGTWRRGGKYVLLVGQVLGDASIKDVDFKAWAVKSRDQIAATFPGVPIRWRPHPVSVERGRCFVLANTEFSTRPLSEDLHDALCTVTFNSNTGVDAVLAGVPTVTMDIGAMAWDVSGHQIGNIETPDRTQWAHDLAYKQWSLAEIEKGIAWEHLRRYRDNTGVA